MDIKDFSDEACVDFIKSLEIPVVEPAMFTRSLRLMARSGMDIDGSAKNIDSNEDSAFVAGNSVVSFVGGLEPQLKQDVMDSVLFAQLAADKNSPIKTRIVLSDTTCTTRFYRIAVGQRPTSPCIK